MNNTTEKKSIETLVINRRDIWACATDCFYDMLGDVKNEGDGQVRMIQACLEQLTEALAYPKKMVQALKEGHTLIYMPSLAEDIEKLHTAKTPFIVVIMEGDKVFAAINGEDCDY